MFETERRELVDRLAGLFSRHFFERINEEARARGYEAVLVDPDHLNTHAGPNLSMVVDMILGLIYDPNVSVEEVDEAILKLFPKFAHQAADEFIACCTADEEEYN